MYFSINIEAGLSFYAKSIICKGSAKQLIYMPPIQQASQVLQHVKRKGSVTHCSVAFLNRFFFFETSLTAIILTKESKYSEIKLKIKQW